MKFQNTADFIKYRTLLKWKLTLSGTCLTRAEKRPNKSSILKLTSAQAKTRRKRETKLHVKISQTFISDAEFRFALFNLLRLSWSRFSEIKIAKKLFQTSVPTFAESVFQNFKQDHRIGAKIGAAFRRHNHNKPDNKLNSKNSLAIFTILSKTSLSFSVIISQKYS